jgi:hypothetical protein
MTRVVRPYQKADRDQVVALWDACGLTRPWNDPDRDIERKLGVDPDGLLVLCEGEEVLGTVMCGYEGHRGWINYLAWSMRPCTGSAPWAVRR